MRIDTDLASPGPSLVVPLALIRPRLGWAWGQMWALWAVPAQEDGGDVWRVVVTLAAAAAVFAIAARTSEAGSARPRTATR